MIRCLRNPRRASSRELSWTPCGAKCLINSLRVACPSATASRTRTVRNRPSPPAGGRAGPGAESDSGTGGESPERCEPGSTPSATGDPGAGPTARPASADPVDPRKIRRPSRRIAPRTVSRCSAPSRALTVTSPPRNFFKSSARRVPSSPIPSRMRSAKRTLTRPPEESDGGTPARCSSMTDAADASRSCS